jgi:outer membrane lipase/esterase
MKPASRSVLFCVSILLASGALAGQAEAQTVFTTIQAFGDSYADTANLIKAIGPIKIAGIDIYPTGRFSGGTNFVDTTSALLAFRKTTLPSAAP